MNKKDTYFCITIPDKKVQNCHYNHHRINFQNLIIKHRPQLSLLYSLLVDFVVDVESFYERICMTNPGKTKKSEQK